MNLQQRVESLRKDKSWESNYETMNFICVNEFKWSYPDLIKTPIPFVLSMTGYWDKVKKEEKKASRRIR